MTRSETVYRHLSVPSSSPDATSAHVNIAPLMLAVLKVYGMSLTRFMEVSASVLSDSYGCKA